jgi:hypothetical protein
MVVKSISDSEDKILLSIIQLHNDGRPFEIDATFSRGSFYRSGAVPPPLARFDIDPQDLLTTQASATELPVQSASVESIIFDPPFMFNPHGKAREKNAACKRFTMFDTWSDLETTYRGALSEFRRILKPGGLLAFKCQDYTDAKTTMTHCLVYNWATEVGFYAKDIFIRYRHNGPAYNPALRQRHARKFHSYWWVFQNAPSRKCQTL